MHVLSLGFLIGGDGEKTRHPPDYPLSHHKKRRGVV